MTGFAGLVHESWLPVLEPFTEELAAIGDCLRSDLKLGQGYLPAGENILRALRVPLADVRVLITGQDPYPTPGHAVGLSFSVERTVRPLPRSLVNIFKELQDDLGCPPPSHGDLGHWADQGVMLLNRVLTVAPGRPQSHQDYGWQPITEAVVRALGARSTPLVAILWGNSAQELARLLPNAAVIATPHPSPLSASRGFFGSRPFSRANQALVAASAAPIDWCLV